MRERGPGAPPPPDRLPLPVVDNHTHLDLSRETGSGPALGSPDGPGNRATVHDLVQAAVDEAAAVGVDRMVQIGCDPRGVELTAELAERHTALVGGLAIHPNEVPALAASGRLAAALEQVERLVAGPRIRVVGETGLDYFRTGPQGRGVQQESFRWHIDLAKRAGLALQIHDRDAHDDVLRILDEQGAPRHTVLHCFSGDLGMARTCVERGYYLSFSGTVTFKNARRLRDALAVTPLDRLLVETDAPYLTPHPHRGAPNAPYLLPVTVRAMAAVLDVDVTTLCAAVSGNAERVYGPW